MVQGFYFESKLLSAGPFLPVGLEEYLLPKSLLNSFFFEYFSCVVVVLLGEGCLHRDAQLAMKLSRLLR